MKTATDLKSAEKKKLLTKKEVAEFLNLSIHTIDAWVSQRRELPFIKVGRRVMFDRQAVNDWLAQNTVQPVN